MSLEDFEIKRGETIYTVLRHVSNSGMTRDISLLLIRPGNKIDIQNISYAALEFFHDHGYNHYKRGKYDISIRTKRCGMDMGFEMVYNLSNLMFGDGYALRHQWI